MKKEITFKDVKKIVHLFGEVFNEDQEKWQADQDGCYEEVMRRFNGESNESSGEEVSL